ncbi:MAG: hypothetical protein L6R42_002676 [Xanthoria sp. 1 TBL-2021]|nr:MAG: hypothetical protein L6R42_002676 [Xanthoria sp. 1 TBL-2021]
MCSTRLAGRHAKARNRPKTWQKPVQMVPRPDVQANESAHQDQSYQEIFADECRLAIRADQQEINRSQEETNYMLRVLASRLPLPGDAPANPSKAYEKTLRYFLPSREDKAALQKMSQKDVCNAFRAKGGFWKHIRSISHKQECVVFYIDSPEAEKEIRTRKAEISDTLGLSRNCKIIDDNYLVHATLFDFDMKTLPRPNERISEWSESNGVKIVQASWRHQQLILSLDTLADAKILCGKKRVYLEGQRGKVKYEPQCGKCAESHNTKDCNNTLMKKCRNCLLGHEAWSLQCRNPEVSKMREKAHEWRQKGPSWASQEPHGWAPPPQKRYRNPVWRRDPTLNASKSVNAANVANSVSDESCQVTMTGEVTRADKCDDRPKKRRVEIYEETGPPNVPIYFPRNQGSIQKHSSASSTPPTSFSSNPSRFTSGPDEMIGSDANNTSGGHTVTQAPQKETTGPKVGKASKGSQPLLIDDWIERENLKDRQNNASH